MTDIKTGNTHDLEWKQRLDLKIQLMLYGYLVHEKFHQWPKTLRILPLRGEPIDVPFDPAESETLARNVRQMLTDANQAIENILGGVGEESDIASPSPDACRFCRYRPTCEAYWSAKTERREAGWPRDVSGVIVGIRSLGSKFSVLEIRGPDAATLVVRGIQESALQRVVSGMTVRICDLKAERAVNVYSWRPTSFIWSPRL